MASPERFGSYLVYEQIGRGGMATVHRAELATPDGVVEVALKRLVPTTQRELIALFLDEARLMRYLQHPNIAGARDSGKLFGSYFIALEYVRGPTVKELIEHCRGTVGALPQGIVLNLAAQLCDALDHAHNQRDEQGQPLGIVHRDVTPANLILSPAGGLKLIDFGLAKASVISERTTAGFIKGKLGYVAPEYIAGSLDHRADLWAVGIIMYELLTTRRLFDAPDAMETMRRVMELPIPRPSVANPRVSRALDEIVLRALARDPDQRWPSAAAMRDRIREAIAQPGNAVDDRGVATWVTWALEQKQGHQAPIPPSAPRQVRLLTDMPLDLTDATAASIPPLAPEPEIFWTRHVILWLACAAALALLLIGAIVWKIVS